MEDALTASDALVIDCSEGVELLENEGHHHEEEEGEEDGHGHDHDHGHFDPHYWMDVGNTLVMAENIAEAMAELDAVDAEIFMANAEAFHEDAHALQEKVHEMGIPEGEFAAVFHEGFAYLTELFHMENVFGIFADEYEMPSAKELAEATDEAKEHGIRFFLTAEDNGRIYAETLATELDETIILLDPLTTADEEGLSYVERMEKNIKAVESHWKEGEE